MQIKRDVYYRPRDIVKHKLILSSKNDASYNFVLKEIREGRLKAENRGRGKTPYFWVKGSDIIAYRKENNLFIDDNDNTEVPATDVAS